MADDLNVGHLMLLMQFGNMSKELTRYNTKLFAETGDAAAEDPLRRMGGSLVAAADGSGGAGATAASPGLRRRIARQPNNPERSAA